MKIKDYYPIILVVLLLFLAGCTDIRNNNLIEVPHIDFDLKCTGSGADLEYIVRSQQEYQSLIDNSPDLYPNPFLLCVDYKFPEIDFSKYTLLGRGVSAGGCDIEFERKVFRDDQNKKYIYSIKSDVEGTCEKGLFNKNWILIDKIPNDYGVDFNVKINIIK